MFASLFPGTIAAQSQEENDADTSAAAEEHGDEYNEFGVKKGTIIYGEDISELTEEELQYVPEAWREGEFESEHPEEEPESRISSYSTYPDVNRYIESNNLKTPKIEYNHISHLTKFNYRNGYGKPEGVVAHETANNTSTITGEISFMSRNHRNAFVHAFIDGARVIETHPTDYGAWGAGRYANERFIHVELVRVHRFDQFARSINNYAEYIAGLLYKYDLGVTDADPTGKGTLWSHRAVSLHLGGTTHVDPHGYFARWGYNWNQFVQLVNKKYDEIAADSFSKTSKLGHIRSSGVKIYKDLDNPSTAVTAGDTYTNSVYYIKEQARVDKQLYYLISNEPSSTRGTVGWVKAGDLSTHDHVGVDKKSKTFMIKGTGNAYSRAWGGNKNLVYNLSNFKNREFKVHLTEKVGKNIWYRGNLDGQTVWIHSSYLTNVEKQNTSKLGHIRNSRVQIYENIGDQSSAITAGDTYTNAVYYIKQQATLGNELYYLISKEPSRTRGTIGWVKAKDLSTHDHVGEDKKSKTFMIKGTGKAYSKAWGGNKDLVYNLSDLKNRKFNVHLTEKVGKNTWYRGNLDGERVWIHSSYLTPVEEKNTSRLGHIRSSRVKIYEKLGDDSSAFTTGSTYTHSVYYIKQQATLGNQLYYLISNEPSRTRGTLGWVKAQDLSTHTHVGVDKQSKTFTIKGTGNAYARAWGGNKNLVYNLSNFKNRQFNVHLTEKVGNNIWYRGNLDGKTVWIHNSYLK